MHTIDQLTVGHPPVLAHRGGVRRRGNSTGHGDFSQMQSLTEEPGQVGEQIYKYFMERVYHREDRDSTVAGPVTTRDVTREIPMSPNDKAA